MIWCGDSEEEDKENNLLALTTKGSVYRSED